MQTDGKLPVQIENIISFAEIHGWCSQTDTLIASFVEELRDIEIANNTEPLYLRLDENPASLYETLILVVMLYYMGDEGDSISRLILPTLNGRISLIDMQFCFYHFFGNDTILPQDLTFDLTSRSFLSYKAAIYKALKIEKTVSAASPENTALYLIVLLSRMDINEQNKVMIALLISKLDANLPAEVSTGVYSYLENMIEIIKEVLEKGDEVLSDSFNLRDEPILHINSSVIPAQKDEIAYEFLSDNIEQTVIKKNQDIEFKETIQESEASSETLKDVGNKNRDQSIKSSDAEIKISTYEQPVAVHKSANFRQENIIDLKSDGTKSQQKNDQPNAEQSETKESSASLNTEHTPTPINTIIPGNDIEAPITDKQNPESFIINFNKNPDFILELLDKLAEEKKNEIDDKQVTPVPLIKEIEPIVEKTVVEPKLEKVTDKYIEEKTVLEPKLERATYNSIVEKSVVKPMTKKTDVRKVLNPKILLISVLITIVLFMLILPINEEEKEAAIEITKINETKNIQTAILPEAVAIVEITNNSSGIDDWDVSISEKDNWIWRVHLEQSFWKLYNFFYKDHMVWHSFLFEISTLNPELINTRLIEPNEEYIVPPKPESVIE